MPITLVDLPVKLPAQCASCHSPYSPDGRKYLDLNIDVLRYGRIYICTLCFDAVAREAGYVSKQTVQASSDLITELEKELSNLKDEHEHLRIALASLDFLGTVDRRTPSDEEIAGYFASGEESTVAHSGRADKEPVVRPPTRERDIKDGELRSAEPGEGGGFSDVSTALKINLDL